MRVTTKKNENLSFSSKWMELGNIILAKLARLRGQKSPILPHMWNTDSKQIQ
jgi:hypothetical protein